MNTVKVAKLAGVHKDTLLRWLRAGVVSEPRRDRRGWREWTLREAEHVAYVATGGQAALPVNASPDDAEAIKTLQGLDWNFAGAKTNYLTHNLHPYPAKFIPQIPNALIQELSSVGEIVLDPFCGSGTIVVEALTLKRQAIGIDASPIACLVSRAKTVRLSDSEVEALQNLGATLSQSHVRFSSGQASLFGPKDLGDVIMVPASEYITFWFEPHVVSELAHLKSLCLSLPTEQTRTLAQAVFSSIVVGVSKQDSDTRYVRREKNIRPGDTISRFQRGLDSAIGRAMEFADLVEERFSCQVTQANILAPPDDLGPVDLVVCSPPYPNAYSYHLYHMTRMLWLDMDPGSFKTIEIGSHRKYSRKGAKGATVDTFRNEMRTVFRWLHSKLKPDRYCCFVIGDSILNGVPVHNDEVISEVAQTNGFKLKANIARSLQESKKSFNPKIGNITQEHVLILKNARETSV